MEPVNIPAKFGLFSEHWRPKVVAQLNGQEVKLIKVQGVFPWHHHETEDELFPVTASNRKIEIPRNTRGERIQFENVSFRYPTRTEKAIGNIDFTLDAGSSLAVVGATGSGKSTLIRLLLRFYEPTEGQIYFGGHPLSAWSREELRSQIGVVHQEIYLFQGTVRENLSLGRSQISDEELIEHCRRAQFWDFIKDRGGLQMQVYEGGTNFSLGERQLLSFARIMIFNTPVLVLDEATSSVDRLLERRLMEAIHEVVANRTSIVIAHRLTTIQECKKILVLEEGGLVEQGTFPELLAGNGVFRRFHDIHSRG